MAEPKVENEPTIVERWLQDQQQWQRTVLSYLDSMTKNDEFLVHLGNAMRGSLLAGKPYPTAQGPGAPAPDAPSDERLDQLLHAVHLLQGQMQDVLMTLEEIRAGGPQRALPLEPSSVTGAGPANAGPASAARLPKGRRRKAVP